MTKQRSSQSGPPPARNRRASGTAPGQQRWLIFGIVGVAVLVFVVAVALSSLNRAPKTDTTGLAGANPKALGPDDAPVVVKDYSDFT